MEVFKPQAIFYRQKLKIERLNLTDAAHISHDLIIESATSLV